MTLNTSEIALIISLMILLPGFGIIQHEITHKQLYQANGCQNTSIELLPRENPSAFIQVEADCQSLTMSQQNYVSLVQDQVEATHYITLPLYLVLGAVLGTTTVLLRRTNTQVKGVNAL